MEMSGASPTGNTVLTSVAPSVAPSVASVAPSVAQPSTEHLTLTLSSVCCLLLLVMLLVLLVVVQRRESQCCRTTPVCHQSQHYLDPPPQYHSSRLTLVAPHLSEQNGQQPHGSTAQQEQSGHMFLVSSPSSYSLPTVSPTLPRLPSYESVRKKDRRHLIHSMIAQRFGLHESPPTYEESIRQSVAISWEHFPPLAQSDTHERRSSPQH